MSIVTTSPTLSYVSSADVSSVVNDGLTKYEILFDASLIALGNLIMFEYKFQDVGASSPTLANTSFGFISVEDAIQSGIENQYVIAVPAESNTLDGAATRTIQVRVYFGVTSVANNVVVTPWSNVLDVRNPPVTPVIYSIPGFDGAFYDPDFTTDRLYVYLDPSQNQYDYSEIKFVVCYFFQDTTNATVWSVSDPLAATDASFGAASVKLITVPNIGTVSTTSPYVYVSIHAVYDWVYSSNNYYAVSYMSNEVIAPSASSDTDPNITSVVYNVYTGPVAVPGTQTMTVTWEPPGNSALPFYSVDSYTLYYSVDGSSVFYPYDTVAGNILTATVNVGTGLSGLNLGCGQNIRYRVDALTVQGNTEPSPESDPPTNIFKYAQAVTDLTITNTTYGSGLVGMTVNFTGLDDTTKGCGAGVSYVVSIDGSTNYVPISGLASLNYSSGTSYSLTYTGLPVSQTGNVVVSLLTNNTNASPASPLAGVTATTSYIANNLVLQPVVYDVYSFGNDDQQMQLDWNDPALGPWTVSSYTVEYSLNGGSSWITDVSTNNDLYTFDASAIAALYQPATQQIQFRVLAAMTTGSVNYTITSNVESQNTFKYAEAPATASVNWSVSDPSNTYMDIRVQFTNPSFLGIDGSMQYFIVTVKDLTNNTVGSPQEISYVASAAPYFVNFDNLPYVPEGTVNIAPYVRDTNSPFSSISYYSANPSFITGGVPIFLNVSNSTPGFITGNIVSNNELKPFGSVYYPVQENGNWTVRTYYADPSSGQIPGIVLTEQVLANNEFYYTFTVTLSQFFPSSSYQPSKLIMAASNDAGIGQTILNTVNY